MTLALPAITTLLGLTGLATGTMTLLARDPVDAMRAFGLSATTTHDRNASSFPPLPPPPSSSPLTTALVRTYATRNIGGALTLLSLTAFWKMQVRGSPAEDVARRCLGLCVGLGTVVAVGDAGLVRGFAGEVEGKGRVGEGGGDEEIVQEARKAAWGHLGAAVVIGVVGGVLWGG